MEGSYAEKVLANVHYLCLNTRGLYQIMRALTDKGVLTTGESRSIMLLPDNYTKTCDLYNQLVDKGEEVCRTLLDVWTDTGNEELRKKVVTSGNDKKSSSGNSFQLKGEEGTLKIFKVFPADIQSATKFITEIDLVWVEIDAYIFPSVLKKCSHVKSLKLNKVKITGMFPPTKVSLKCLTEFHLNMVGGRINYHHYHHNVTESVRFLIFFDTKSSVRHENNWELNGDNIWNQNCDIIVADDGKVLLASFPERKSFTASFVDIQSILQDVTTDLEILALSRVHLNLKTYPKKYYNIHENLSTLILHNVDTENLAAVILSSRKLKTLKVIAKDYPQIDTGHFPSTLTNLSLGSINLSHNSGQCFSMETVALDYCILADDIRNNFHDIFHCKYIFISGEGYLFQPSFSFLDRIIKNHLCELQWVCLSGFTRDDLSNCEDLFLDQNEFRNATQSFTVEIINGSWKGQACSKEQIILTKYELFGWDSFWEKENFVKTQINTM